MGSLIYRFPFPQAAAGMTVTVRNASGATVDTGTLADDPDVSGSRIYHATLPEGIYVAQVSGAGGGVIAEAAGQLDVEDSITAGSAVGMKLLGPYTTTFDTPGVSGDWGIGIGPVIPAGSVIVNLWAVCTDLIVPSNIADSAVYLGIFPAGDIESGVGLKTYDLPANGVRQTGAVHKVEMQENPAVFFPCVASVAVQMSITWWPGSGAFTAGSVDVYALIGEPVT